MNLVLRFRAKNVEIRVLASVGLVTLASAAVTVEI